MFRKRGMTTEEIHRALAESEDDDIEGVSVAIIPPPMDILTDEEDVNDENIPKATIFQEPAETLEPIGYQLSQVNEDEPSTSAIRHKRKKKDPSVDPKWEKCEPEYKSEMMTPSKNSYEKLESLQGKSTMEMFEQLLSDVLELMLQQTLTYALQKNDPQFTLELNKIKTFVGILLFSGYHKLPQQNMYWEQSPDAGIPLVYNAMTRQKFKTVKRYLHLNDSAMIDASDKMYELRPFLDALNTNFQKFGIFHSHLSIDEMMIRYYGMQSAKIMKGKPIKFGYQFWCLCSEDRYLYNFAPYLGKENEPNNEPLGIRVIKT